MAKFTALSLPMHDVEVARARLLEAAQRVPQRALLIRPPSIPVANTCLECDVPCGSANRCQPCAAARVPVKRSW